MLIENDRKLLNTFSFIANPEISGWENSKKVLGDTRPQKYFNKTNKLAYHNLCTTLAPPSGLGPLLGLGMKFCIKSMKPNLKSLPLAFERLRRDMRLRYNFAGEENLEFNPRLYIKSTWEPPDACPQIERRLDKLEKVLTSARDEILKSTHPSSNLSIQNLHNLRLLTRNPEFIVVETDKGLGPAVIERETYVRYILNEHLNNGYTYEQLSAETALEVMSDLLQEIEQLVCFEYANDISDNEDTYFKRGLRQNHRIPQFYGLAKIHKVNSPSEPIPWRPVNSQCGGISAVASTYVDYYLQKLIPFIPGVVKNSIEPIHLPHQIPSSKFANPNV